MSTRYACIKKHTQNWYAKCIEWEIALSRRLWNFFALISVFFSVNLFFFRRFLARTGSMEGLGEVLFDNFSLYIATMIENILKMHWSLLCACKSCTTVKRFIEQSICALKMMELKVSHIYPKKKKEKVRKKWAILCILLEVHQ